MSDWIAGEVPRLSVQVTDAAGQPADPGSVVLKIKSGSGVITNKTYPGQIVRAAAGVYHCDVALTEKGRWLWRWETGAPYQGACQGILTVEPSNI